MLVFLSVDNSNQLHPVAGTMAGMLAQFLNFDTDQHSRLFRDIAKTCKQQPTALPVIFISPETEECKMR